MPDKTFTALFDTYAAASTAVTRLEGAGVPHERISLVSNDPTHDELKRDESHIGTGTGASLGTLVGGGAGLLAGLGLLAIPGLGPVVAAGWLASTVVGAGVGAAAGGIVGALTDAGVNEPDAFAYAEGIQRGGTLLTVKGDESQAERITAILEEEGTVDLDARAQGWRDAGWMTTPGGSSPTAAPADESADPLPGTATALTDEPGRSRVRVYDTTI